MTLDDLHKVYDQSYRDVMTGPINAWSAEGAERAGLKAVVEALRDEMAQSLAEVARQECCGQGIQNYGPPECCCTPVLVVTTEQVNEAFHEILASEDKEAP